MEWITKPKQTDKQPITDLAGDGGDVNAVEGCHNEAEGKE